MKVKFNLRFLAVMLCGIFATLSAMAQDITVKGTVNDAFGDPVMGATVLQVGTTNGCVTDLDGNFSLKAPEGAILRFSFIGYRSQEHPAAANMTITLEEDSEMLEDVVVIGYGVARKNDLTGSVTAIKADDKNKGFVTNAQDMLSGKVAGVSITNAGGAPGSGSSIRVRGGSSLNASNDPLIVIDGLAMDNNGTPGMANALSMVNPADIESFTVLKDASATAIYGSRGSNGVIIITTKKGVRDSKPHVMYNGNVSASMPKGLLDVMSADEFRPWVEKTYGEAGTALLGNADTDWQKEIYRTAISTDHNVTVAGGVKNMPYRATVGYTNENGILKTSGLQRTTASFNLSPAFFEDHLTFNINGKGMFAKTRYANTAAIGSAVLMDPTQPVRTTDPTFSNFNGYFQWLLDAAYDDPTWPSTYNSNATANPVAQLEGKKDIAKSYVFQGNIEGTYKTHGLENLVWHANYGWNLASSKQNTDCYNWGTDALYYGNTGSTTKHNRNISFNAYTQWLDDIDAADQHYDVMVGYEWQHIYAESRGNYWGIYPDTNNNPDKRGTKYNETNPDGVWGKTENYIVSFFGRANYNLLGRYGLTATVRYDGSSRFEDHWALFPAFAFAWNFKEEAFLKDVDVMNEGKLRLSYGQTGQQEIGSDYAYFASYNETFNQQGDGHWYPVLGDGNLQRPNAYNKSLKWETTTTYNAGLDLGFFDNRFTLNADVYYRETTDLINDVYVSAGSNFRNKVKGNIGSLENKGFEVMATFRPIQKQNLSWEFSVNAAYNKNEVTELIKSEGDDYFVSTGGISAGTGNECQAFVVGKPAHVFHVYQQVYDENTGLPIEGVYVDRNGDGEITTADKYYYKQAMAPWTAGFSTKVNYKNWDFGMNLRASFGNYVFNDTQAGNAYCGIATVSSYNHLENRPMTARKLNFQSYDNALSDYFVQNGSFLKCDNITVGYSFNNAFGTKINGRVYAAASNVFTITKYEGVDPEVFGGIDNNVYPRPFNVLVGLSLNF